MKCPICNTELVLKGCAPLESLVEHCCDPNGEPTMKDWYACPIHEGMWTENGEHYHRLDIPNPAPRGTLFRKLNAEKTRRKTILSTPWFMIELEIWPTADYEGEVLKNRYRLSFWKLKNGYMRWAANTRFV